MTEIEPERQVLLPFDISIAAWVTETTKQHRIPRKALDVPASHFSFAMPSVMENSPGTQHHLKMTNLERIVVLSDPITSFLKTREAGSSEFARVSQAWAGAESLRLAEWVVQIERRSRLPRSIPHLPSRFLCQEQPGRFLLFITEET